MARDRIKNRERFKAPLLHATELGESIRMEGDLKTGSSILVKGVFSGSLESASHVGVDRRAELKATRIQAESVLVQGRLSGTVRAALRIEIRSGASVSARLEAPVVGIEPGSEFEGEIIAGSEKDIAD